MPRVPFIDTEKAQGGARRVFQDQMKLRGRISTLWRTRGWAGNAVEHAWQFYKNLMAEPAEVENKKLTRTLREKIGLITSKSCGCTYCVSFHSSMLGQFGLSEEEVKKTIDYQNSDIPDWEKKVLKFVEEAATEPHKITDQEFKQIRSLGFTNEEMVEIAEVIAMFVGIARLVAILDIEPDEWLENPEYWLGPEETWPEEWHRYKLEPKV